MPSKKNQILLTPKNQREFDIMIFAVVFLESLVRKLCQKHKKLTMLDIAHNFLDEIEILNDHKNL